MDIDLFITKLVHDGEKTLRTIYLTTQHDNNQDKTPFRGIAGIADKARWRGGWVGGGDDGKINGQYSKKDQRMGGIAYRDSTTQASLVLVGGSVQYPYPWSREADS